MTADPRRPPLPTPRAPHPQPSIRSAATPGAAARAFILCGGAGTRLGGDEAGPKALVSVAGRPFLLYLLRDLQRQSLLDMHLLLGVGAPRILAALPALLAEAELDPARVSWSVEAEPLGTGGALAAARHAAAANNLILNGDSYAEADLGALLRAQQANPDVSLTLLAVWQDDRSEYGGLALDADGYVTHFEEKGSGEGGWINAGAYAAGRAFFAELDDGARSLERTVLPPLAAGRRLRAHTSQGYFRDIGTPQRLALAQAEFPRVATRLRLR